MALFGCDPLIIDSTNESYDQNLAMFQKNIL
jgi:hypothetical protein